MEKAAVFRFYESLNDFLLKSKKHVDIHYRFSGHPAIKDAIESMGIPHIEVDSILVNGVFATFFHKLADKDDVHVYPLTTITNHTTQSLTPVYNLPVRFIADVPAGKVAKNLRMLGFDTAYNNKLIGRELVDIAEKENRIVLTRDIALLKHKKIKWGYWLRSQQTDEQLIEVIKRYDLSKDINPLVRCIECNNSLVSVDKETILQNLPAKTIGIFNEFYQCEGCKKVYWKGSHYENMLQKIESLICGLLKRKV